MPIDDHDLPGIPPHAGFGPVLDCGFPPSVARGRSPLTVPLSTRAGALAAGIALAVAVLALPAGALALAVAQIKPALAARNAHATHAGHVTATTPAAQTTAEHQDRGH